MEVACEDDGEEMVWKAEGRTERKQKRPGKTKQAIPPILYENREQRRHGEEKMGRCYHQYYVSRGFGISDHCLDELFQYQLTNHITRICSIQIQHSCQKLKFSVTPQQRFTVQETLFERPPIVISYGLQHVESSTQLIEDDLDSPNHLDSFNNG